jgi:CBS domain-containing protein
VLLARLYGLRARSAAVATDGRLADAVAAGHLGEELGGRLRDAYRLLATLRLRNQLRQIEQREYLTDRLDPDTLTEEEHDGLREAFRAIKSAQSVTAITFRTDL